MTDKDKSAQQRDSVLLRMLKTPPKPHRIKTRKKRVAAKTKKPG